MHTYVYISIYIYIYLYIGVYMCINIHIYIYIYRHQELYIALARWAFGGFRSPLRMSELGTKRPQKQGDPSPVLPRGWV